MKSIQLLILNLLMVFATQAQTNYYVSKTGNDTNSGTSLAGSWLTIQHAANKSLPNSTVNILSGVYNELVTINVSGALGKNIIFKNYLDDTVIISGVGFHSNNSCLIKIEDKNNIVIDGLILENLTCAYAHGIMVITNVGKGVENITLKNLKIRNIGFTSDTNIMPISGDNAHGIEVFGKGVSTSDVIKNVLIENCDVYHNINGYSENITVNGNVDGYFILNNMVHDNSNIGIDVAGNFGASSNPILDHARNGIISNNKIFNNISGIANSSGIYCDGCKNTIIERNMVHHNTVGITVGCEKDGSSDSITVRDNFIFLNTYTGIQIGGYDPATTGVVQNSIVRNNTCFYNDTNNKHGEMVITKTNNCDFYQNILYSKGRLLLYIDKISPQNFTSKNNEFYSEEFDSSYVQVNYRWNTISYNSYKATTSKDSNSIFKNPKFIDTGSATIDLHIQSTSPAINSGMATFIAPMEERDIDGQNRTNGIVDIGADEFYSTSNINKSHTDKPLFWVYPNPSNGAFYVNCSVNPQKSIQVKGYDLLGQNVYQQKIDFVQQNALMNLNVSNGTYILELQDNAGNVQRERIVIQ